MDEDEENQDLINQNSTRGKSRRQRTIVSSDEENVGESDESQDEEGSFDEEDNEEAEEDESDSEEDDDEEDLPLGTPGPSAELNDALSSDEEKENCPICLNVFRDQVVGTPEHCNHYFCLDCIVEWSKNANSCPVDRITYSCINIRAHYGGAILKRVPVDNKAGETKDDDDVTNCEVCGRSDREDRLLLCDYCDSGYHMECLTPALDVIPVNEWFCPECTATYNLVAAPEDAVVEEESGGLLENIFPTSSQLRTNLLRHRAIARTRQSERVRSNVNRIRTRVRNVQSVPSNLLSSLLDETIEAVVAGLNTAVYQRNLTPRVTTRKRKRKFGRRKRRTKRRKGWRRQAIRKTSSSHRRITRSLGLCNPSEGSSIPRVQRAPEQTIGTLRNDIGAATLSVFGTPYDLDPVDSDEDNVSNHTSPLAAKRRVLSRSALRSHQPVARPISVSLSRGGVAPLPLGSVAAAEPVPDLLGSILSGQSMLMMNSSDIVISRDGSLTAKRCGEGSSLRSSSGDELAPTNVLVSSTSPSGSSTATSSVNTLKPVEQLQQPSFASSGLYSLSPLPSPPPTSSSSRLSMPNSSMSGMSTFRLKNAFTPRAVQVQSSAGRLSSKCSEPLPFNGTFHKQDCLGSDDNSPPKKREFKHPCIYPEKRLDISEFPRIPKIKKECDNTNNESSKREELASCSANTSPPKPSVNQLTGRGESKQLGRFTASEKHTRQEPQAHSRHLGGGSSSHSTSSSSKAPIYSNSSRNVGSSDSGGGGLRITISGSSSNSCRQFSPSAKDPFRPSEDKTQQKVTPVYSTTIKKEKNVKNEIYDPFEPTGSDSASHSSSPERPVTPPVTPPVAPPVPPPVPTSSTEVTSAAPSSGVKIGAFRSFKFTTHSSKVGLCKLGPDFSGQSPSNKESDDTKTPVNVSPVLSPFVELEKEIKKEVIKEEKDDHADFRTACPFSGLKITSDLKSGGTRGFHFDVEDQHKISIKSEPESPTRIFHPGPTSNRLVWDTEFPSETISLSTSYSIEPQKKKSTVETELTMCSNSRSRSRTHSRDQESRSPSWSMEDKERGRKYKSKSHKGKRAHNDRSSSGSCERSKKKRQKEKKRERKSKLSESKERKRSRSTSHSSSSHRTYNSKKKKKKKRDSKAESRGRSSSPEKEKKRKHKADKSYTSKEGNCRTKEKKKPKDDRGKQRPKSPQMTKEYKANKLNEKTSPHFRDQEITRHIVLSPNNNDTTITCTVSFKTECPPITQDVKPTVLPLDEVNKKEPFLYMERDVLIKKEKDVELSDRDEEIKVEIKSPPWSPSLLDSLLPEHKSDNIQELPSTMDSSPLKDMSAASLVSPQASPLSTGTEPPSPKSLSPQSFSLKAEPQTVVPAPVKKESDDLQWSPSHLDDFLLNELSDDMCSVDAASPDDVDLEEAILMKREDDDYTEPTVINFSKKTVIPFLQDDENSSVEEAGNHIAQETSKNSSLTGEGGKASLNENEVSFMAKSKPQIKRVTWNLHHKDSEKDSPEKSVSSPFQNAQQDMSWSSSVKLAANQANRHELNQSGETSGPLPWNAPDTGLQDLQSVRKGLWNAEDTLGTPALDKSLNEGSQIPWNAAETPNKVFPQTLPPLPLPPIFPPYAPLSEPTVPCVIQSSKTTIGQTPKPGALASTNEPKIQAANTGKGKQTKGKSKAKNVEKDKNEEYMKKLHMQERAVEEVKLAIKPFYQKREITKDEYKEILRKAVQKICHSKSGEINPVKVVNLVKGYVDKYKHIRNKQKKSGGLEDPDLGQGSPIC